MRIRVLGCLENDGDELEAPHSHGSVSSHPGRLPRQLFIARIFRRSFIVQQPNGTFMSFSTTKTGKPCSEPWVK